MGVKKKEHAEILNKNQKQTAGAETEDASGGNQDQETEHTSGTSLATSESLTALLERVESSEREWPQKVLLSVMTRFGRMPRGGWNKAKEVFCDKFGSNMGIQEFTKRAKKALTTSSGRQCSNREFKLEATKRRKTVLDLFEEKTHFESKVQMEALKIFREKISLIRKQKVEDMERTRKIFSLKVDALRLDAVIKSVESYVGQHPPRNMSEIARILQTAQICYQEITKKEVKPSVWRESILKKIETLRAKVSLLCKVRDFGKLSEEENREAKKIMREVNLKVCLQHDVSEAIAIFDEKAGVCAKKLEVSQKRKEYRQHNQNFELYRNNFYRKLGG